MRKVVSPGEGAFAPLARLAPRVRGLPRELLQLYEIAHDLTPSAFELRAARQLGRLVGFDGAVWGHGRIGLPAEGLCIDAATVLDRPDGLLMDYPSVSAIDPVTRTFLAQPERMHCFDSRQIYGSPRLTTMLDYTQAYALGQLLLLGQRAPNGRSLAWVVLYRSPGEEPFAAAAQAAFKMLLPHWLCARRLCGAIHRGDLPPADPTSPSPRRQNGLSGREREVLLLMERGYPYTEVAMLLGLSVATVRTHTRNLYEKLGVHGKTEAVFEARQLGWLD